MADGKVDRTRTATVSLSLAVAWPLSLVLIVGSLLPMVLPVLDELTGDEPTFTSFRDEEQGGVIFAANRMKLAPIHYRWLHAVPALMWSAAVPLQHTDSIRRRFPTFHRYLGRLTATISLLLILSGLALPLRKRLYGHNLIYSHPNDLHLHRLKLNGFTVLAWPTFTAATWLAAATQGYSLYRLVVAARAGRFSEHRTWAVLYSLYAYVVPIQRVAIYAYILFGSLLAAVDEGTKRRWGVPKDGREQWDAERAGFAATVWIGAAVPMAIWARWTFNGGRAVFDEHINANL